MRSCYIQVFVDNLLLPNDLRCVPRAIHRETSYEGIHGLSGASLIDPFVTQGRSESRIFQGQVIGKNLRYCDGFKRNC